MNSFADFHAVRDPGKEKLPYVKDGKFSLIFLCTCLAHLLLIILPFFVLKISDLINPPIAVEQVSLADQAPADSPDPVPALENSSARKKDPSSSEKKADPFALPDLPDIPKFPDIPQKEKTIVKEKNPEKVTPKRTKKFVSPENIKVSRKKVKHTVTPRKKKKSAAQSRAERIRALLRNYDQNNAKDSSGNFPHRSVNKNNTGRVKAVTSREMLNYYEQVRVFLMSSWRQPNAAQLNNARPEVKVLIHVDASGRIVSAKIVKRSGNRAMDESVETLLRKVRILPKPPEEMTFSVNVNIE